MVYLDENLSYRDERSAELCGEQAADEEITQSPPEELQIRHSRLSQPLFCVCDMYICLFICSSLYIVCLCDSKHVCLFCKCVCVHNKLTNQFYKHPMAVIPPHTCQSDRQENEKQHQVMEDQHPVLQEESLHCLKRVAAV